MGGGLWLFSLLGALLVLIGGAMLIVPRVSRAVLRAGLGLRITPGPYERVAAWLLVVMGLAVMLLGRVVR